jgi:hypothetical protein
MWVRKSGCEGCRQTACPVGVLLLLQLLRWRRLRAAQAVLLVLLGHDVHEEHAGHHLRDLEQRDILGEGAREVLGAYPSEGKVEVHDGVHGVVQLGSKGEGAVAHRVGVPDVEERGGVVEPLEEGQVAATRHEGKEGVDELGTLRESKKADRHARRAAVVLVFLHAEGVAQAIAAEWLSSTGVTWHIP